MPADSPSAAGRPAVLLLIPNLGLGGAQRVFADHAQLLARHYQLTECVFNFDNKGNYQPSGDLVALDVPGGGNPLARLQHFRQRVARLRDIKQARHVAVAISHLEGADYVNVLGRAADRQILCVHGSKLHDRNINGVLGWLRQRILIPRLYRRAARIVTVSAGIRDELVRELGLPANKVQVINNFFDIEQLQQRAAAAVPAPFAEVLAQYPVLVTAARFAPEKNLLALLDVFVQVRQRVPACRLLLIGEGEQQAALLARCQALGLPTYTPGPAAAAAEAAVLFAGLQANPHAFMARATVFVLPSLNEGFPMALGEAMVCGVPVAAADCPTGPREILAPGTPEPAEPLHRAEAARYGVLLPVISPPTTYAADVATWVEALVALLGSPAEQARLSEQARHRMQDFSRQRIAAQWLQLVEAVRQG